MYKDAIAGLPVIGQGPTWTLFREPALMMVRFTGVIDDEASAAWRAIAKHNFDTVGWPRYAFVAVTEGSATTSLASRMRTAAFLRLTAQNVERVFIVSSTESTFIIRTILRTAGASNVELIEATDAPAQLKRLRQGAG